MDPYAYTAIILALCLVLTTVIYVLGVEVGKATALRAHPGYSTAP